MTAKPIDVVVGECAAAWLAIPGVVGVGVGEHAGEPCIRVFVETASEALSQRLPSEVDGYCVLITESGSIEALDDGS